MGQHGVASGPVRSPPLAYRSGVSSASAPVAASQAPCVPVRTPPFPIYPVWQPPPIRVERPPRGMDTGYHARRCFAAIRYGDGLPHGRFGKIRPSARATAVAVPYGHRRRLPQRHHGGRRVGTPKVASDRAASRFGFRRARRRFSIPSVAAAACVRAPATTPGAGGGSRDDGARSLRVDTHPSPHDRRLSGCRHSAPGQRQGKLPRHLSAEILPRAFAPRRATSGLVRIPPASVAYGGEGRSLGERTHAANVGGCTTSPAFPARGVPLRGSPAGHGLGCSFPIPPNPRPARYTAVAATHAASGTRRRAVAHGHANASVTRAGGLPPLSCPLPTVRLRGRRPVIRASFPSASLCPRFRPRPHRPVCNLSG
jgi:hypothetical protein